MADGSDPYVTPVQVEPPPPQQEPQSGSWLWGPISLLFICGCLWELVPTGYYPRGAVEYFLNIILFGGLYGLAIITGVRAFRCGGFLNVFFGTVSVCGQLVIFAFIGWVLVIPLFR